MGIGYYLAVPSNSDMSVSRDYGSIAFLTDNPAELGRLPSDSLPVLTDREGVFPWDAAQVADTARARGWHRLVLDFQRPEGQAQRQFVRRITAALPGAVAVSQPYAPRCGCPVFLPPCPHHVALSDHLKVWKGREIWLDLALDGETITLTGEGATIGPVSCDTMPTVIHRDHRLHCRYIMESGRDSVRFTLWRTKADLQALAKEAEALGVTALVGLYEELTMDN